MAEKKQTDIFDEDLDALIRQYTGQLDDSPDDSVSNDSGMSLEDVDRLIGEVELDASLYHNTDVLMSSPDLQKLMESDNLDDILSTFTTDTKASAAAPANVLENVRFSSPHDHQHNLSAPSNGSAASGNAAAAHATSFPAQPAQNPASQEHQNATYQPSPARSNPAAQPSAPVPKHSTQILFSPQASDSANTDRKAHPATTIMPDGLPSPDTAQPSLNFPVPLDNHPVSAQTAQQTTVLSPESDPDQQVTDSAALPRKKSGAYVSLGVIVTLLALAGIVGLGILGIRSFQKMFDQSDMKAQWNHTVYPLVATDVPEFNVMEERPPSSNAVVAAGIWSFILNEANKASYEKNELGVMTVPALDVETHIKRMFGPSIQIVHQSIQNPNLNIEYQQSDSNEAGVYHIPSTPPSVAYKPNVIGIDQDTDTNQTIVTVAYMVPLPFLTDEELFSQGEVAKTMRYYYTKDKDLGYLITRVQLSA